VKRFISMLCVLALAGASFAFAGGSKEKTSAGSPSTLKFVFWITSPGALQGWQSTLAGFEKENPNIKLDYVGVDAQGWAQYIQKVATMIAGGENPDVMWVATEGIRLLSTNHLSYPVDSLLSRDKADMQGYLSDVPPSLLNSFRIDGKLWELPYSFNDMVMWYNSALFKKAGIPRPASDWTVEDFLKTAQKLTVSENGKTTQYGFAVDGGYFTGILPWLFANGTSPYKDNMTKGNLDDPRVIQAVQFMHDLIYKYKVSPVPGAPGFDPIDAFVAGKVAMFGAGRWPLLTFIPEHFKDGDIQLWPRWRTQTTLFGVDGFSILRSTTNRENAWKLVKYMTTKGVMGKLVGSEKTPISNLPARTSLLTGGAIANLIPDHYLVFTDALKDSEVEPAPPQYPKLAEVIARYLSEILQSNTVGVKQGLLEANQEINSILAAKQ